MVSNSLPQIGHSLLVVSDASSANLFPCWQPVDTGPPSKDFNLGRKFEAPQVLPKRLEWVPLRTLHFFLCFNQAMGNMVRIFYSEFTPVVPHPD